jgi:LmbE family N-acetylglucosaminyl deacetylase
MIFGEEQTVLVLAAHPDDELLGCGGTLSRHCSAGAEVHVLIITDGASAQYDDADLTELKKQQAEQVGSQLGFASVDFADLPDMRLDEVPHVDLNETLTSKIDAVNPSVVYTHSRNEVNLDHRRIHDSTLVATRPSSDVSVVLAYETPSSSDWYYTQDRFRPSLFVDITDHINDKISAFELYSTEVRDYPHPRSARALRALAERRGGQSGYEFAEGFSLVRMIC